MFNVYPKNSISYPYPYPYPYSYSHSYPYPYSYPYSYPYPYSYRRVARIFCGRGGGEGGAYLKNWDQIMNVLNDTLC